MTGYKTFNHTADLGIEVSGKDERELFSNAAFAVFDITTDLHDVNAREVRRFAVEGSDLEDLLVNYLREVLYMFSGQGLLLKDFSILEINGRHLVAEVRGEPFDSARHSVKTEIKAVTYHEVEVRETEKGLKARLIFDV